MEAGEGHRQGHEDSPHLAAADIEILTPGDYVALCLLLPALLRVLRGDKERKIGDFILLLILGTTLGTLGRHCSEHYASFFRKFCSLAGQIVSFLSVSNLHYILYLQTG